MSQKKTMSGEDTVFMLEAILAIAGTEESKAQFLNDPRKVSRLILVKQLYDNEVMTNTLNKLKEVVYES